MDDHADQSLDAFLDALADTHIGPAGGAAAAVSGAIGAATVAFACDRTQSTPSSISLSAARQTCLAQRTTLLALASRDTAALRARFAETSASSSADDRIQHIPVAIAEACETVLTTAARIAPVSTAPVCVDLLTGGHLTYGALQSAVRIGQMNLESRDTDAKPAGERLIRSQADGEDAYQSLTNTVTAVLGDSDTNGK